MKYYNGNMEDYVKRIVKKQVSEGEGSLSDHLSGSILSFLEIDDKSVFSSYIENKLSDMQLFKDVPDEIALQVLLSMSLEKLDSIMANIEGKPF